VPTTRLHTVPRAYTFYLPLHTRCYHTATLPLYLWRSVLVTFWVRSPRIPFWLPCQRILRPHITALFVYTTCTHIYTTLGHTHTQFSSSRTHTHRLFARILVIYIHTPSPYQFCPTHTTYGYTQLLPIRLLPIHTVLVYVGLPITHIRCSTTLLLRYIPLRFTCNFDGLVWCFTTFTVTHHTHTVYTHHFSHTFVLDSCSSILTFPVHYIIWTYRFYLHTLHCLLPTFITTHYGLRFPILPFIPLYLRLPATTHYAFTLHCYDIPRATFVYHYRFVPTFVYSYGLRHIPHL